MSVLTTSVEPPIGGRSSADPQTPLGLLFQPVRLGR